jgi:hypothetical protein
MKDDQKSLTARLSVAFRGRYVRTGSEILGNDLTKGNDSLPPSTMSF